MTTIVKERAPKVIAQVLPLAEEVVPVLAVGAFLKNTICLAAGREAYLTEDVGNLDTVEAIERFEGAVQSLIDQTGTEPVAVAHDLHPDFHSTRFAEAFGPRTIAVQHHHAHVAAVMAEHGLTGPVLGLALDGFGLGARDESWGGELLRVDTSGYERLGHLYPLKQPGGDAAARQPWRMGAAALHALGRDGDIPERFGCMRGADVLIQMLARDVNAPPTSSCGRLFDAACGLLGVKLVAEFEGEAPMQLENMVTHPEVQPDGWRLHDGVLDLRPLLSTLLGVDQETGANLFHGTLVAALTDWAVTASTETGLSDVALCGGCLLNAVVREGLADALERRGLTPRLPRALSPGDQAVSLGQAWAAGLQLRNTN